MAISETREKNSSQRSSPSSEIRQLRRSLKEQQSPKKRKSPTRKSSKTRRKRSSNQTKTIHPLLQSIGVTELPPLLQRMGVTPEALDQMDENSLREIVKRVRTLSRRLRYAGPQNDDELWEWVKRELGAEIPRVAVCPDHVAPFKVLADLYFERTSAVLVLANRGGAKTFIVACLHFVNSTYKPGCESLSFGATEGQGRRCYGHIEDWCYKKDPETGRRTNEVRPFIRDKPLKTHTVWNTGSVIEVVAGSENAVSGPHPAKAHADEIDLMERGVWNQSRGMAVTNQATGPLPPFMKRFNGMIPPQDIATSTRNTTKGLMQELLDEIEEDNKNGDIPQFDLYSWCIWETIQEIPSCRNAPRNLRQKRLAQLGHDPESLCQCHRVVKGRTREGERRTLQVMCGIPGKCEKGHEYKGFRARGWKPYIDIVRTFKRNTPGTWLLQHECRHGRDEKVYIEDWSLGDYGIRDYEPHPLYGPIYQGVDWGATNPACVLWFQYLTCEVPAIDFNYQPIWLMPGTYVLFHEIYAANLDAGTLGKRVIAIEESYRRQFNAAWEVKARFTDPQGKGDRITWSNMGLKSSWPFKTRNKERMITTVQNIVIDDRFAVDVERAPMFCEEVEVWQKKDDGKEFERFNHAMSSWRYGISNAEVIEGRLRRATGGSNGQKATGAPPKQATVTFGVQPSQRDHEQVHYGSVAAVGGTGVPLDPNFTLNVR
jgi:hypothetical protein